MQESYFMSQDQQDAVIGRVNREYKEAANQLALLEVELAKHREKDARLAEKLTEIDYVVFDGEQWPEDLYRVAGYRMSDYSFSSDAIDGQKLKVLCRELRAAKTKRNELATQLKTLGV